jgi:hypothetical protein
MSAAPALAACVEAEILSLHDFFVRWFSGKPADFGQCEEALHADFTMVTPDGQMHSRAEIINRLRAARASTDRLFRIEIEEVKSLWHCADATLASYVEAQFRDGKHTRRLSSALFVESATAANKVVWRHLHETWM